jgi:DhnA family fructose-bisphosphate aldolase class Ia
MTGRRVRLGRIFREDERAVVVALDHGQFKGAARGLESMPRIVEQVVAGGADAVILNPGPARRCVSAYAGRSALIVRVTGASTEQNTGFDYHRRICTVAEAVHLGADAVIAMGFVGGPGESASLVLLAEIAVECARFGMPLIAEMLVADSERFNDVP